MKTKHLVALMLAAGITMNVSSAPNPKPPQDVNVVNTPNVTMTNPQTSVTVDNTAPIPVDVQGGITVSSEPQFVGFSNNSVQGDVGLVGMHGACAATYGENARMCLDIEVFKTPNLQPVLTVPSGWINMTNSQLTCRSWTTSGLYEEGSVLSGERMQMLLDIEVTYPGGVRTPTAVNCSQARPVACCQ